MRLYFDSSALVKLIRAEAETESLTDFLREHSDDGHVTSTLARVEVLRAVAAPADGEGLRVADGLLGALDIVKLTDRVLDDAASLLPGGRLRTLDAIHLAAARRVPDLRAVVTYDHRMSQAAADLSLSVVAPGA